MRVLAFVVASDHVLVEDDRRCPLERLCRWGTDDRLVPLAETQPVDEAR